MLLAKQPDSSTLNMGEDETKISYTQIKLPNVTQDTVLGPKIRAIAARNLLDGGGNFWEYQVSLENRLLDNRSSAQKN